MDNSELVLRIEEYASARGLVVGSRLGFGLHGMVFDAENQDKSWLTAIEAHFQEAPYLRERDVYLRLQDHGVIEICGCNVPRLIGFDDGLWIIEMTVVARPFVLDFGAAYLDRRPHEFSEDVLAQWQMDKQDEFGVHWVKAQVVLWQLETRGIFMEDVRPSNIWFLE